MSLAELSCPCGARTVAIRGITTGGRVLVIRTDEELPQKKKKSRELRRDDAEE